jgi:hypothetical protein
LVGGGLLFPGGGGVCPGSSGQLPKGVKVNFWLFSSKKYSLWYSVNSLQLETSFLKKEILQLGITLLSNFFPLKTGLF